MLNSYAKASIDFRQKQVAFFILYHKFVKIASELQNTPLRAFRIIDVEFVHFAGPYK